MKILHTADWHLGHLFFGIDRQLEQQQFLHWLTNTLLQQHVDVLLISGDVFDVPNPSNMAIKMFYEFLKNAQNNIPELQIIITAGNHDSAYGLERPIPLINENKIKIIGALRKNTDGTVNYNDVIIPIKNAKGTIELYCMAIPFIRRGDYQNNIINYIEGVHTVYNDCYTAALQISNGKQGIIAMGHLHTAGTSQNDEGDTEKNIIIGGQEKVAATCFNNNIIYTALGHIHIHQKIAGKDNIRYSGSPLPMSFAEYNYKHVVLLLNISDATLQSVTPIEVPTFIQLHKLSKQAVTIDTALQLIAALPPKSAIEPKPYLEIKILEDVPILALNKQLNDALQDKNVILASVKKAKVNANTNTAVAQLVELNTIKPEDILDQLYKQEYNVPLPQNLLDLFAEIYIETQTQSIQ